MRLGVSDFILLLEKPTTYTHTPSHSLTHTHTYTHTYTHTLTHARAHTRAHLHTHKRFKLESFLVLLSDFILNIETNT